MRIPFVPKNVNLHKDRVDFISQYRGGGFMLIAGSVYWFLAFIFSYILSGETLHNFYTFGGFSVPVLGYIFYKLLKMKASSNQYASLVGFASAITACCFPILLLLKDINADMLLPALCIINAAHLLILCWIHLEYLYFILVIIGECLSMVFIYSVPSEYTHFISLAWGCVSLLFGIVIHNTNKNPLKGYDFVVLDK